jgi:hypothetical protein
VNVPLLLYAAALLTIERITYVWIWRHPDVFRAAWSGRGALQFADPVDAVQFLFYGFKLLQAAVFLAWCYVHGGGTLWPIDTGVIPVALGAALMVAGQVLSTAVFWRLGKAGVFYGNRFGYQADWCRQFPFTLLDHPQYVGAVLSIWGFFLLMRFPHGDWFVLPALETLYYTLGARFEREVEWEDEEHPARRVP